MLNSKLIRQRRATTQHAKQGKADYMMSGIEMNIQGHSSENVTRNVWLRVWKLNLTATFKTMAGNKVRIGHVCAV